jgi:hypothetical protein
MSGRRDQATRTEALTGDPYETDILEWSEQLMATPPEQSGR